MDNDSDGEAGFGGVRIGSRFTGFWGVSVDRPAMALGGRLRVTGAEFIRSELILLDCDVLGDPGGSCSSDWAFSWGFVHSCERGRLGSGGGMGGKVLLLRFCSGESGFTTGSSLGDRRGGEGFQVSHVGTESSLSGCGTPNAEVLGVCEGDWTGWMMSGEGG